MPYRGYTVRFHSAPGDDAFQVQMPFAVTEKVRPRSSPALAEFEYARAYTSLPVKMTVPSPTLISAFWVREVSADAYPDVFDLIADAVDIVKQWIVELSQADAATSRWIDTAGALRETARDISNHSL